MKKVINIMKASINLSHLVVLFIFQYGILFLFTLLICLSTTDAVLIYKRKNVSVHYSNVSSGLINLICFSTIFSLSYFGGNFNKNKTSWTIRRFLIAAPILKEDFFNAKFMIFLTFTLPAFLAVIYVLLLNIFVSPSNYISALSGFIVLIYCLWLIIFSPSTSFSGVATKKFKLYTLFRIFFIILIYAFNTYMLFTSPYKSGAIVTSENMYSDFGPLVPLLKFSRYFGGITGLIVMILSTVLCYFCCKNMFYKISEEEGI